MYRNLERNTLKLERSKSHLMFNETCYNKNTSVSSEFLKIKMRYRVTHRKYQESSYCGLTNLLIRPYDRVMTLNFFLGYKEEWREDKNMCYIHFIISI